MRRPSLSTKLLAAAVPLLIAIGALLFVTVRNDLDAVNDAERSAQLGAVWSPMISALSALDAERDLASESSLAAAADPQPTTAEPADAPMISTAEATVAARKATDDSIAAVRTSIEALSENPAAVSHITSARSSLSAARRNLDMAAANMIATTEPLAAYGEASSELVAVARLLPPAAGSPVLGRQLLAVQKIAESNLAAGQVIAGVNLFTADPTSPNALISARDSLDQLESTLNEFEVIAPEEWASQFRRSGMTVGFASFRIDVDRALRAADLSTVEPIDVEAFSTLIADGNEFQREITSSIVEQAQAEAADTRQATLIRIGIIGGAVALAMLLTWLLTRSIAKRVRAVAKAANQVATRQLPTLVHAMRDPKGRALPTIDPVNAKGSDELAELAESFNTMQRTLVSVAEEQRAVLRKGVSDIFITMARRNRSLVDRQLAMLDGFESQVDDPDVLANYYQLDHLATRMRRNAESLLVLANEEPRRRRVGPTDVDNVVRASIGEIEDYRRIQVEHLDSMKVRGNVVADIAHLFAELLDNAAQFSPPNSTVRLGGRLTPNGYTVRINDAGVGISPDRLEELNELLRNPPIVGLSVEPTLGMSVVSLLAAKHGITVTLIAGAPGLTVDVELPNALNADAPDGADMAPGMAVAAGAAGVVASGSGVSAQSNALRIDDSAMAKFAAEQGLTMTSASVNNVRSVDDSAFTTPEPIESGVNGYHTSGVVDGAVNGVAAGVVADDSTFVMPDTFGSDSQDARRTVSLDGLASVAGSASADRSLGDVSSTGDGNTFTMPDDVAIESALATSVSGTDPHAAHDAAGDGNTFSMPDDVSIETALAESAAGTPVTGNPTGAAGDGNTFAMPDEASIERSLAEAATAEPTFSAHGATSDGSTFTMPDDTSIETALAEAAAGTPATGAAGDGNTFAMPDEESIESALTASAAIGHGAATGDESTFTMPAAIDATDFPVVANDRPVYTRIDPFSTETAADAAERNATAFVLDESTFALPSVFDDTRAPFATNVPVPPEAPAPAAEPMFRTAALDFGGSQEADEGEALADVELPTQLDRPNITARLTDAFQRSHLNHTTPVAAALPNTSATPEAEIAFSSTEVRAAAATHPPAPSAQPSGEFSRPLSPPNSASSPTSKPVTPADAHPAPRLAGWTSPSSPLPTRRANEVDGGPDRMADLPSSVTASGRTIDEEANALAAALAAFDRRLENHHAANGNGSGNGSGNGAGNAPQSMPSPSAAGLPTRSPAAVTTPMSNYDAQPESTTTSRLDPEQLRERLRSFHTGVRGAVATDTEAPPASDAEHGDNR